MSSRADLDRFFQASKAKTQSDREQRLREDYRYMRGLYLEMTGFREGWKRRALKAESEFKALRETLRRLSEGAAI